MASNMACVYVLAEVSVLVLGEALYNLYDHIPPSHARPLDVRNSVEECHVLAVIALHHKCEVG